MVRSRSGDICTYCGVFHTDRKKVCYGMANVGLVFSDSINMGNMGSFQGIRSEYQSGNGNHVRYNKLYHFLHYIFTLFKKDMLQITAVGKIFWALGSLIWGSSLMMALRVRLLDIDFAEAPPAFKNTMYFLSCVFLSIACMKGVISCIHSYQKYRTDRLANDVFAKKNGLIKKSLTTKNKQL